MPKEIWVRTTYLFPVGHLDLLIQRRITDSGKCPSSGKLLKLSSANAREYEESICKVSQEAGSSRLEKSRTTRKLGA